MEQLAGSDSVGVRALWALALDAFVEGETSRALRLQARLRDVPPGGGAAPLRELLNAVGEAGMGRHAAALMRSHRLLGRQTATVLLHGSQVRGELLSDPFARSLLHLQHLARPLLGSILPLRPSCRRSPLANPPSARVRDVELRVDQRTVVRAGDTDAGGIEGRCQQVSTMLR